MPADTDPLSTAGPEEPVALAEPGDLEGTAAMLADAEPAGSSDSLVESLGRLYGNPAEPPQPAPPQPAATPSKYAVPEALGARHPNGGLIAMRLLSRMQTDLAALTEDKRPATYEEAHKYLGYALVAEGVAPRGYTAEQAADWWSMGGSARLHASATGVRDDGSVIVGNGAAKANPEVSFAPSVGNPEVPGQGDSGSSSRNPAYAADDAGQDGGADMASPDALDPRVSSDAAGTTENASEALADPTPATPSPAVAKPAQPVSAKAAKDAAIARAKQVIAAAKAVVERQTAAPFGDDLLKRFGGFGDQKYTFGNDYRTTPQMRAWLPGIEPPAKPDIPYPDGLQIDEKKSPAERRRIRDYVAYLYTLPEVKALLDLIAHNEGPDKLGYYLSHGANPSKLPDLDSFHGGNAASGRYQIEPGPWRNFGQKLWSRNDFSPITQDLIAITQLYQSHAIDALMNGDLSRALTLASGVFASIHVSVDEDHSRYGYQGTDRLQGGVSEAFRDLPAEFAKHLALRRAEFSQAEQAWKADKTLPWAFIPPTRWDAFGIKGFPIPKK